MLTKVPFLSRLAFRGALVASAVVASTALSAQESDRRAVFERIQWVQGPADVTLGKVAQVGVPEFCRVTDDDGAKLFMEATENPPSGAEVGILLCSGATENASQWFVVFSYDKSGLVKDDEKSSLDQAAMLKVLQRGTEAGNAERRRHGWGELEILGWTRAPYYDPKTHNLTWSTRLRDKTTPGETINHSVRLLGRGGVMHADLVVDPSQLGTAVVSFDSILVEYSYLEGQKYSEWREGDKIAAFGLTALVAGGAGAAAVKFGLFGKLWKVIIGLLIALKKVVVVAVVGIGGFIAKLFKNRGERPEKAPSKPSNPASAKAAASRAASGRPDPYKPYIPPGVDAPPAPRSP